MRGRVREALLNRWLRRRLERWARGRAFWRRLPRRLGGHPVRVSGDARLRHLLPGAWGFDRPLLQSVETLVEETSFVWDIGANVGAFSLAAAHRARFGRVLAVEPDPWLLGLLSQTINHPKNRHLTLKLLGAAVGQECGLASLVIAHRGRASNHLDSVPGREMAGGVREKQLVPLVTLDSIAEAVGFPDVVKIDCEGAESNVLAGGRRVFGEGHPVVLIEVAGDSGSEVVGFLEANGYEICNGHLSEPHQLDGRGTRNLLARPTNPG